MSNFCLPNAVLTMLNLSLMKNSVLSPYRGGVCTVMVINFNFRLSETARLLRNVFRRSRSGQNLAEEASRKLLLKLSVFAVVAPNYQLIRDYTQTHFVENHCYIDK